MTVPDEKRLAEIAKSARLSRRALKAQIVAIPLFLLVAWCILRFSFLPRWIAWIVVGVTAFTFLGDLVNLAWTRRNPRPKD